MGGFFAENLRWAGVVSYSGYLLHPMIIALMTALAGFALPGRDLPPLLIFGLCASGWVLVVAVSTLYYYAIEQPGIALGKRLIQARRARRPGEPGVAPATAHERG